MLRKLFIVLLLLSNGFCSAQTLAGARQTALANSDIALGQNVFSLFSNPSAQAKLNKRQIGFFYSPSPFGLKELATAYFAYVEPTSYGNFAIGFMNYGFELYTENKFQFAYSGNVTESISYGISAFYKTVSIHNYGNTSAFNFSFGGIYSLTENFSLGFALQNPFRFFKNKIELPMLYTFGTSYEIPPKIYLNFAVQKEIDFPFSLHFGVEIPLVRYFILRFGIQNQPDLYSGGLGINYSILNINYAVTYHKVLGLTHQAGIIINLGSKK